MRRTLSLLTMMIMAGMAIGTGVRAQGQAAGGTGTAAGQAGVQPKAYEMPVSYQKTQLAGTLIDWPYPQDVVEDAIRDYMGRKGYKGSGSRGYTVYRNVRLEDGASELNDLHIKVDRKNRYDKGSSIVTMLTVRPNEDPGRQAGRDTLGMSRAGAFLERMTGPVQAFDLEERIKTQGKDTKKAQDKLTDLRDDQVSLERKIRDAKSDLEKNQADQLKISQAMNDAVTANNPDATKKAHKKMDGLIGDQASLQKKIQKYEANLAQNKKDQEVQQWGTEQQQKILDSLKSQRQH